jgi:hypothetical protein
MCIFVDSFIETGTKLQKDVRLVKALIDLIEQDESIDDSVEFMVGENGDAVRKDQLRNLKRVCLPSFLLGIWHFIVINRKNNKVGQLTYDTWCPENGGGTREYEGTMGDGISIEFDVYTLEPEDETEDTEQEAEVVEDQPERNNQDKQNDHRETSGTGPNLQQINNPFTFIQNGDNNTQIGYIANQTIVKK